MKYSPTRQAGQQASPVIRQLIEVKTQPDIPEFIDLKYIPTAESRIIQTIVYIPTEFRRVDYTKSTVSHQNWEDLRGEKLRPISSMFSMMGMNSTVGDADLGMELNEFGIDGQVPVLFSHTDMSEKSIECHLGRTTHVPPRNPRDIRPLKYVTKLMVGGDSHTISLDKFLVSAVVDLKVPVAEIMIREGAVITIDRTVGTIVVTFGTPLRLSIYGVGDVELSLADIHVTVAGEDITADLPPTIRLTAGDIATCAANHQIGISSDNLIVRGVLSAVGWYLGVDLGDSDYVSNIVCAKLNELSTMMPF